MRAHFGDGAAGVAQLRLYAVPEGGEDVEIDARTFGQPPLTTGTLTFRYETGAVGAYSLAAEVVDAAGHRARLADLCRFQVTASAAVPSLTHPDVPPAMPWNQHIVQPGDTLLTISQQYNVPVDVLLACNPAIDDPDVLYPGQVIALTPGQNSPPRSSDVLPPGDPPVALAALAPTKTPSPMPPPIGTPTWTPVPEEPDDGVRAIAGMIAGWAGSLHDWLAALPDMDDPVAPPVLTDAVGDRAEPVLPAAPRPPVDDTGGAAGLLEEPAPTPDRSSPLARRPPTSSCGICPSSRSARPGTRCRRAGPGPPAGRTTTAPPSTR